MPQCQARSMIMMHLRRKYFLKKARYFIEKPIENEEILRRINTVIANTN